MRTLVQLILVITLSTSINIGTAQINNYYPLNGLIHYFPFKNSATDVSGNNAGVVVRNAGLTTDRFGNCNEAYYFNGVNSYMATHSSLLNNLNHFTISFWIKIEEYPVGGSYVFAKGKEEPILGDRLSWRCYIGGYPFQFIGTDNWFPLRYATTNPSNSNEWIHMVMTNNGSYQKVYLNGKLTDSIAQAGTLRINPDSLYIGTRSLFGNINQFFKGKLDDIVLWNRALTKAEIESIYFFSLDDEPLIQNQDTTILCGNSFTMRVKSGYTYQWIPANGLSNPNAQNPIVTANSTIKYILKASLSGCNKFDTITIQVIHPSIQVKRNEQICLGDSIRLTASGAQSYQWKSDITLSDTMIANPYAKPTQSVKYFLTANLNGCLVNDTVHVQVVNTISVDAGLDSMICIGDTIVLNANGGTKFSWTPLQDILSSNTINPRVFPKTPTWYYVVGSSGVCTATDSVFVDVKPLPQLQIDDTLFCGVSSFTPTIAMQSGISRVLWEPQTFLSTNSVLNPIISATSSVGYNVTAQTDYGCSASDSFNVKISNVIANFSVVNHPLEVPENLSVVNTSSGNGLRYTWLLNNQPWSNAVNPQQLISSAGMYTVKLIAEDLDGCIDSLVKNIEAKNEQKIFIPNVFSPNGDNINDKFIISIDMSLVKKLEGTVWNRWGQKVADFNGVQDNWWDGKSRGTPCADGVYYYIVTVMSLGDSVKSYQGTITILR